MTNPNPAAPLTEREARDAFLRAMQDAHLYGRERQRLEDAADAMALAARATSTPAGLREAASDLADAVDTYLDNKRSPELWVADRARVWKAAKEVRAALQGADR
jgi:hypothetical protein